jgi:putative transposase
MQITRGYRTELDLNNEQITLCKKHAGVSRFAYNWGLTRKQEVYAQTGRSISAMELHRELNALKQTDFPWMYEVSKCAPQEALRDLDNAFSHFFRRCQLKREGKWKGKVGYPKFKSKRKGLGSFRLTGAIHVYEKAIDLPRLGQLRLKRLHRHLSRKAKGSQNRAKARQRLASKYARVAHVRRDAHHQASSRLTRARLSPEERAARRAQIASTLPEPKAKVKPRKGNRSLATQTTEAPPLAERIAQKIKKKRIKRILRQATEADAALRPRVVVLEDLNVEAMKRNRKLALAISDVGMGEFRRQMGYKSVWQGEDFLLADRFFPSTKKCSNPTCGNVKEGMELSERIYVCEKRECGLSIDRDLNAALNLAALAR